MRLLLALTLLSPLQAAAENVTLKIGYSAGGGYDTVGRFFARHIGRFLPGEPTLIVENVPGGGSLKLAKLMMEAEPADGSVIGMVNSSIATATVLEPETTGFSADDFVWIGSLSNDPSFCYAGKNSGIESIEDFTTKSFKVGSTGKASQTYTFSALVKNLFNPNIEIIVGFEGGNDVDLAVDRGEIQGRCGNSRSSLNTTDRWRDVNVVGQWATSIPDELKDIPDLLAMIDNEEDRKAARLVIGALRFHHPFFLPKGTDPAVVATYREAFDKMIADPEFLADAAAQNLEIAPTPGAQITELVKALLDVDDSVVLRAQELSK